jgi:hypothetical protein
MTGMCPGRDVGQASDEGAFVSLYMIWVCVEM